MLTRIIALLPLFVCRLLGFPVPYSRLFPEGSLEEIKGQILLGDSTMPATSIEGAGDDRNRIRNARLAKTTWKTWTLLRVDEQYLGTIRVMYGTDQVLLADLKTGNIAVRNGAENCRFAVIDGQGREVGFEVICRGDPKGLEKGFIQWLLREGHGNASFTTVRALITFV